VATIDDYQIYSNTQTQAVMNIDTLTTFFMWCTIVNGAMLIYTSVFVIFAPDFIYRMQSKWFSISRESFNIIIYSYLGLFKILFITFCLAPYLALLIMG
tara:strand:- start:18437 stop:18733 length:297 start_codon:yes stop_codon:yes gene_type:complete